MAKCCLVSFCSNYLPGRESRVWTPIYSRKDKKYMPTGQHISMDICKDIGNRALKMKKINDKIRTIQTLGF
jgi:hypothetical protein